MTKPADMTCCPSQHGTRHTTLFEVAFPFAIKRTRDGPLRLVSLAVSVISSQRCCDPSTVKEQQSRTNPWFAAEAM
jgi:hypothetical protein